MILRVPIAALFLALFGMIAPAAHAQEGRDLRAHVPRTVSETQVEFYPTLAEVEEIKALPPSPLAVPETFYGAHPDFVILLPCLEAGRNPGNGNSLILRNRCNFGLTLEGSVSRMTLGRCPSSGQTATSANAFYVKLLPGEAETEFSNFEQCLNNIHDLKIWTPERAFEEIFGPDITTLRIGEFDADGAFVTHNVQTFDHEKSAERTKSNLCYSNFWTLETATGPLEAERTDNFWVNWRGVASVNVGSNYAEIHFARETTRGARIYFTPDTDRQAVAAALNRIMFRCSPGKTGA